MVQIQNDVVMRDAKIKLKRVEFVGLMVQRQNVAAMRDVVQM